MSQQINLILEDLKPKFDWLGLPVVASGFVVACLLVAAGVAYLSYRVEALQADELAVKTQVTPLQQQLQALGQGIAQRVGDASLPGQITKVRTAIGERRAVLEALAQGHTGVSKGYADVLQGFSRQLVHGVWLTGFELAADDVVIRGRLVDSALLPTYIGKLNAEPVFADRRFATLDMKSVDPADAPPGGKAPVAPARYTEFVLRTEELKEKGRP